MEYRYLITMVNREDNLKYQRFLAYNKGGKIIEELKKDKWVSLELKDYKIKSCKIVSYKEFNKLIPTIFHENKGTYE